MTKRRRSTRRKASPRRKVGKSFGSFLKISKSRGAKLISTGRAKVGRKKSTPVYRVKGVKSTFRKLGSAKTAANKIAYRKTTRRRR